MPPEKGLRLRAERSSFDIRSAFSMANFVLVSYAFSKAPSGVFFLLVQRRRDGRPIKDRPVAERSDAKNRSGCFQRGCSDAPFAYVLLCPDGGAFARRKLRAGYDRFFLYYAACNFSASVL